MKVVIIGAGVSGLSLQYFLCKNGIESVIIDQKNKIGLPIKDTGLISNTLFKIIPEIGNEIVEEVFTKATFIFNNITLQFSSKKSKMFVVKRDKLDQKIYELTNSITKNPKIFLKKKVIGIDKINNRVILNTGEKIKYDILVGADGTYSIVTKTFGLDKNVEYISGEEIVFETKRMQEKKIELYFCEKYSKEHFLWIISYKNKIKVGYVDKVKNKNFPLFVKQKDKVIHKYFDLIKIGRVKLVNENVLVIGEAGGLIKPFSLGGISYGIISSFVASKFILKAIEKNDIKELKKFESITRKILGKGILFGHLAKKAFNCVKKSSLLPYLLKILRINKIAMELHPDFIFSIK